MKRFVSLMLLIVGIGILSACGNSDKLDGKAQKAEENFLAYINKMHEETRQEGNASSFHDDLSHDNVQKVYYSGLDFEEYLFVIKEQIYNDSELKEKDRMQTGHYSSKMVM